MTPAMLIAGILIVLSACGVVLSSKPLYSALWLVVTLFLVAVHFALLGAEFLAAMQIVVYAGAIMVLVVFVIMLLGPEAVVPLERRFSFSPYLAAAATGTFIATLVMAIENGVLFQAPGSSGFAGTTEAVGHALFGDYFYPFELVSILLLAAIIGATALAYEPKRVLPAGRGLRAKHSEEQRQA